ncbi:uncharacterized protein EAF01_003735 [Botrytis porri]|uniref:Uncharacterized protein n=1 Tax=Botrytis porri TaxID=87229 RepID=A0A4Z1L0U4_9HELO|nr:uncharacterized protein EAF01_003735 [Botrytis porri]KAF7910017.1 hypothetical protein EAF01_003735 [Botrytis porri]TGO90360.1 hypothetical protein BPOR_0067g00020 [Botrytis porri]
MSTRITFLGDTNVGKTSMASRILQLDYLSIGSHPLYESIQEISSIVQLDRLLKKGPDDRSDCLVMVYNIGSLETFHIGTNLFTHALGYRTPRLAIMVAIVDDAHERIVNQNDVEQFMEEYKGFTWHFIETSIRDSQHFFRPPIPVTTENTKSSNYSMINTIEPFAAQGLIRVLLETFLTEAIAASWYNVVESYIVEEDAKESTVDKVVDGDHLVKAFHPPHTIHFHSNDVIQDPPEQEAPQLKSTPSFEIILGCAVKIMQLKSWTSRNTNSNSAQGSESFFLEENTLENIGGRLRVKLRWLQDLLCCS